MAKKKILVVDDDLVTLKLVKEILTKEGYEVLIAENGRDGMNVARSERPDLVLMDVLLPDIDGPETVASIFEYSNREQLPLVIFISAKIPDMKDRPLLLKVEDTEYSAVAKPFRAETILKAVHEKLDQLERQEGADS